MPQYSLAKKIWRVMFITILILVSTICYLVFRLVEERTLRTYFDDLEDIAHLYEEGLSKHLNEILEIEGDDSLSREARIHQIHTLLEPMTRQFLENRDPELGIGYYSKMLDANVSVSSNINHLLGLSISSDHPAKLLHIDKRTQKEINSVMRGTVVRYARLIFLEGEAVGHLYVNLPVNLYHFQLRNTMVIILLLAAGVLLFGFFISSYIARLVENATEIFGEVLKNFGADPSAYNRQTPVQAKLPREFNPLLNHFFTMANKISELLEELTIASRLTSLGTAVSIISHDIRNPLTSIRLGAELGKITDDNLKQKQYCQQIIVASDMINNILEQLLLLAKSPADTYEYIDLKDLLSELVIILKARTTKKGVNFLFQAEKDLPILYANRVSLGQAFMNVIVNAIDATPCGGSISVKAEKANGGIQVSVEDTGIGVPEEMQKQIFNKFFTTKGKLGTGLGLALAHSIVTNHQGKIWLDSAVGKGTTFYIWFPAKATQAQKNHKQS